MKRDKIKTYAFEFSLILILFLALFVSKSINRTLLAIILTIIAIIITKYIKIKKVDSIYKKQVAWLMLGFSIIYIIVFYLMGLYFGYYKSPTPFGITTIKKFIIPFMLIILSSERIRKIFIMEKGKLSKFLVFVIMVLIDLIIYSGVYNISNLEDILTILGFILFSSIACNLLYNYIAIRFSIKGIIIYRLITILYVYFIPIIPNVYVFFRAFLRMLYPYIIYLVLEYTYSKTNYAIEYKDKKKYVIGISVGMLLTTIIIGLISCQFKFGILVIGSGSMTGTIDKGDVIIYEKYENTDINIDNIIMFEKDGKKIIHRVVDAQSVNKGTRYYTKGDANEKNDDGYITASDIKGTIKFKIKYIGYPTIWIRDIFF
ncbi:MAG: signal peptidase I [Firmicutes bacterium]|nr:signal peptidase I [Bacillota bacterium]